MFTINAFTKHRLFIKLQNIMKIPIISNYSIDQETIDSILEFEYCPILTTFWQNLLIYTIFDVSFGDSNMDKTKTLKIQYIYRDINITVCAQNIDVIAITVLYSFWKSFTHLYLHLYIQNPQTAVMLIKFVFLLVSVSKIFNISIFLFFIQK